MRFVIGQAVRSALVTSAAVWLTGLALVGVLAVAAGAAEAGTAGAAAEAFAPIVWSAVAPGDAVHRRMVQATRDLTEARHALAALLEQRAAADAAKDPPLDVVLDLSGAFLSYASFQVRPVPIPAPQWQDNQGQSLDRIGSMRQEFMPDREDARLRFARRGGRWYGPQIGMVSTKFGEQMHVRGSDASALRAGESGVSGGFTITTIRGDFRYAMFFSGEGCQGELPELRNYWVGGTSWWPDWWGGPRERRQAWQQRFALDAGRRRGWILKATLLDADAPAGTSIVRANVWAWLDNGRIVRGCVRNLRDQDPKRNNPDILPSLTKWSAGDKSLVAELAMGSGTRKQTIRLAGALSGLGAGALEGTARIISERGEAECRLLGTLYHAFAGTYETDGLDGRWEREVLAGVAPGAPPTVQWPTLPQADKPADLFAQALELYRHAAALDMALREYPLGLAEALHAVREREGVDDRWRLWQPGAWDASRMWRWVPAPGNDLHLAVAAAMGSGSSTPGASAAGAAAYLEELARIARQAVADRKAGAAAIVGVDADADPQFAPGEGAKRMDLDAASGNRLPPADGRADWRLVSDWTGVGFIPRCSSFEAAPYLPEIAIAADLMAGGGKPEAGKPVRMEPPDPVRHFWFWRARADEVDGAVTIPIECLRAEGVERDHWGHVAEKPPGSHKFLDGCYSNSATWYAAAIVHAQKAGRVWLAVRAGWDARVWVNDSLVWRPSRLDTPGKVAVIAVDLKAGANRVTVCASVRPTSDGNSGKLGPYVYKYGSRVYGTFAMWMSAGGEPRKAETVAAELAAQAAADKARTAAIAARGIRGRRGDGSGRYPDAKPPLAWDLENRTNVRWKAALPTDDAEPAIVGNRLFVTTYKGELACLDADSGKERWRRQPQAQGARPVEETPYPPQAIAASFAPARQWTKEHEGPIAVNVPALARSCLSPMADARHVWMQDPRGRLACFDHDGKQVWAKAVAVQVPRFVTGGYVKTRIVPPTHPAIVGSRLVAAVGAGLAAYDTGSGTELWQRAALDYNGRFAVMDFGDGPKQQLVVLSSGEVLDAATGRTLIARCATLVPDSTCEPLVEGRVAYMHACSSAVRFWTDESGELRCQLLWDSPSDIRKRHGDMNMGRFNGRPDPDFFGQSSGAFPPTPVLHEGLLLNHLAEPNSIDHGPQNHMRLHVSDAATGIAVCQRFGLVMNAMRPASSTVVAGGYVFMADEGADIAGHYAGFPSGVPMIAVATAEECPRRIAESRGLATLAAPVFAGRRMYLAGSDQVVCVERPEALGDRLSEHELAAMKVSFFTREIGTQPGTGSQLMMKPPADLTVGRGVPVVPLVSGQAPGRWLFAGPFEVDEKADVFADKGGAGAVHPEVGMKVAYSKADGSRSEAAFVGLDPNYSSYDPKTSRAGFDTTRYVITQGYANALGNPRLEGGINFATASGRKYNTTCYVYTVLEVSREACIASRSSKGGSGTRTSGWPGGRSSTRMRCGWQKGVTP